MPAGPRGAPDLPVIARRCAPSSNQGWWRGLSL